MSRSMIGEIQLEQVPGQYQVLIVQKSSEVIRMYFSQVPQCYQRLFNGSSSDVLPHSPRLVSCENG